MAEAGRQSERIQSLFLAALEIPADARDTWLDEQCGNDAWLLREVRSLLSHDSPAQDPLEGGMQRVVAALGPEVKPGGEETRLQDRQVTVTAAEFLNRLEALGQFSEKEIAHLREQSVDDADRPTAEQLAEQLVKSKHLTPYQARQLLERADARLRLGNYVILDELGRGGMGQVFLARHRRMRRKVALKILPPESVESTEMLERFQREVEAAAKLSHPNVVAAHDADEADGIHFLVMEYVNGRDLGSLVKQDGPLRITDAVGLIIQAAQGLAAAHQAGIIHRDVKPSNLIVDEKGTVKVVDFGLARLQSSARDHYTMTRAPLTKTSTLLGTVDFLSPEQARNIKKADHRADIYSLGCTLYYLLSGRPLFPGKSMMAKVTAHQKQPPPSLADIDERIPAALDSAYQRMVAKKPSRRFQTMEELIAVLLPFADHSKTSSVASQTTSIEHRKSKIVGLSRSRWRQTALIGLAAITILGLAAWMIHMSHSSSQTQPESRSRLITGKVKNAQQGLRRSAETKTRVDDANERDADVSPEVEAAQWILASGGTLSIAGPNLGDLEIKTAAELPAGSFVITKCVLRGIVDVDDGGLAHLEGAIGSLKWLDLTETSVTDQSMALLKSASNLRVLYLSNTSVGNIGLSQLVGLQTLHNLMVDETAITDKVMPAISELNGLLELDLSGTAISDIGLKSLESFANLRNLYLSNTEVTDRGITRLVPKLSELRILRLSGNGERITNDVIPALQQLSHLEDLDIGWTTVDFRGMEALSTISTLRRLTLDNLYLTDEGLEPIVRLLDLEKLWIWKTGVTDITLDRLRSMNSLKRLNILGNPVTTDGIKRLQQALPDCEFAGFPVVKTKKGSE